jgi:hypothetical protein
MSRTQIPSLPPQTEAERAALIRRSSRIITGAARVTTELVGVRMAMQLFEAAAADLQDIIDDRRTRSRGPADGFQPLRD